MCLHIHPENGVDASLVSFPLPLEPSHQIRVYAHRDRLRAGRQPEFRFTKETFLQFRNV
jgi:hypothetical protein